MMILNAKEKLQCPNCKEKPREIELPKNHYKCDKCGVIWKLKIDGGLKLKSVYQPNGYNGPSEATILSIEQLSNI